MTETDVTEILPPTNEEISESVPTPPHLNPNNPIQLLLNKMESKKLREINRYIINLKRNHPKLNDEEIAELAAKVWNNSDSLEWEKRQIGRAVNIAKQMRFTP